MNKAELRDLAEWGARRKVADIERTLDVLQKEFPQIFISLQRPVLLKAELRETTSNGHGTHKMSRAISASWTPERRAHQAEIMRKRQGKMQQGRQKKTKAFSTASGKDWKNKWYQRLKAHGPERIVDSATALSTSSATLRTSSKRYLASGAIIKLKDGTFNIGKTEPSATN